MKKIISSLLVLLVTVSKAQMAFFPSNEKLATYLTSLQAQYPNIVKVQSLGKTTHTPQKDIWAIKISDNVNQTEDEPVWVFTGIIHGAEKLGIRVMLNLLNDLTSEYATNNKVKNWVDNYEIWIIPNMNPYGTDERNSGLRKNGWNANGGVDLNRNWGFRHSSGGSTTVTDSDYRGPNAFSESETSLIRDLYLDRKPIFGCTFHRGNEDDGGQIMRPWSSSIGLPPDWTTISDYASKFRDWVWSSRQAGDFCNLISAGKYKLEDPTGVNCTSGSGGSNKYCKQLCWAPITNNLAAYGQSSNWCYSALGTHDFTIEICDKNFKQDFMFMEGGQPSNSTEQAYLDISIEIAKNWTDGIKEWMDHFIHNAQNSTFSGPGITGHVTDGLGNPIEAKVTVVGKESQYTEERYSDAQFGRYWRLLPAGTYTIQFEKAGCSTVSKQVTVSGSGALTIVDAVLCPNTTNSLQKEKVQFGVFPNPNSNRELNITVPNPKLSYYTASLYTLTGKLVENITTLKTHLKWNIQNLSPGTYILKVTSQEGWTKQTRVVLK